MGNKMTIDELIDQERCIGIDSIIFQSGKITLLDVEFYSDEKYFIGPIVDSTVNSYLGYNLEFLSHFGIYTQSKRDKYEVFVGEGSCEGSGVIYINNTDNESLIWFIYLENSEPFKEVFINGNLEIEAKSNFNIVWKIPIDNPLKIELIFPKSKELIYP